MNRSLSVISVLLLGLSGNALSDTVLLGTWQSNAELTVKSIESVRELSPENREAYGRVFGQMKLSFYEDHVAIDFGIPGAEEASTSYRVINSGSDHITIEFGDPDDPLGPMDTAKYFYEDTCMKRELGGHLLNGAYEYWCKVE